MPHQEDHILGQTDEQRQAAFTAAGVTPTPITPTPSGAITSEALEPTTPPTVTTPTTAPSTPIDSIPETDISEEKVEEPKSTFDESISNLKRSIQGFEDQPTRAETIGLEPEVAGLRKQAIELNKRIQLQKAQALRAEQKASELGETLTGQSAAVRRSQIEHTFKALELAAQAQALTGNLSLARELAGQAVDEKFAEEETQLDALAKNIRNNFKDMTKDQQERALETLERIETQKSFVDTQKEELKGIEEWRIKAAASGRATNEDLDKFDGVDSVAEAALLASPFLREDPGVLRTETVGGFQVLRDQQGKIISTVKAPTGGGVPITFTDSQGNTISLTEEQGEAALEIGSKVTSDPVYKDMTDIQRGLLGVFTGLEQGNGFGDVTAINAFQRMIDPGATVRSEDVVLLQSASAILAKIDPRFLAGKVTAGDKLPEPVRQQMRQVAKDLYDSSIKSYQSLSGNRFNAIGATKGLTPEMLGTNFADSDALISVKSLTPEEKTNELDKVLAGGKTETVESNPTGFFEGFLNIFGLSKK